jgi:hypothetical protein
VVNSCLASTVNESLKLIGVASQTWKIPHEKGGFGYRSAQAARRFCKQIEAVSKLILSGALYGSLAKKLEAYQTGKGVAEVTNV